jgi:hypothetical protein
MVAFSELIEIRDLFRVIVWVINSFLSLMVIRGFIVDLQLFECV